MAAIFLFYILDEKIMYRNVAYVLKSSYIASFWDPKLSGTSLVLCYY